MNDSWRRGCGCYAPWIALSEPGSATTAGASGSAARSRPPMPRPGSTPACGADRGTRRRNCREGGVIAALNAAAGTFSAGRDTRVGNLQQRDALLLVRVCPRDHAHARLSRAGVVGQVRHVRRDIQKVARLDPDMLPQTLAVPHARFARNHIHGAFMLLMQMRFGATARRNRDNVQTESLRARRLRRHALEHL